jgi:flagella basal body P-ring formation protein FlgA
MRAWVGMAGLALLTIGGPVRAATVTAAAVGQAVEAYVRAELAPAIAAGERVTVDCRWQQDLQLPGSGEPQLEIRRLGQGEWAGPTVLQLTVMAAGRPLRHLSLTADVRRFRPVVVAGRLIRRGETMAPADLLLQERPIGNLADGYYADCGEVVGARASRTIGSGEVLSRRAALPAAAVRRGAAVLLVVRGSGIEATTEGVALEDGGIGARIRVRSAASGKVLYGQVADAATVRMSP